MKIIPDDMSLRIIFVMPWAFVVLAFIGALFIPGLVNALVGSLLVAIPFTVVAYVAD